jgi:hypothetical protein
MEWECTRRHVEITPKTQEITHKVLKERILWGVGERAAIWAIYSLCGVPVQTVFWWRPDARCLGKEQSGYARPDELSYPSARGWQLTSGRGTDSVRNAKRRPFGLQNGHRQNCETPPVQTPRGTVRTLHTETLEKLRKILQRSNFLKSVSEHACIINW